MKVHIILLFLLLALAQSVRAETFTVIDENDSQVVMGNTNYLTNFAPGETLDQFLSSLLISVYGDTTFDPVTSRGNDIFPETSAFIIIDNVNSSELSQNDIVGTFIDDGTNLGVNVVFQNTPSLTPQDVPEPSILALLLGSLVGLVFIHRLRFARR
jgi:hypothetical protein